MAVLVLNATYEPLGVISDRRAITLVLAQKVRVVATDPEGRVIRSASGEAFELPTVVALTRFVRVPYHRTPLTRRAVFARDDHSCQIRECDRRADTLDHVVPRARGGRHTWTNLVAMCAMHNHRKADKLLRELGWELKRDPFEPKVAVLVPESRADPTWSQWLPVAVPTG